MNKLRYFFENFKFYYKLIGDYSLYFFKKYFHYIFILSLVAISFTVRYFFALYPTNDVTSFLINWMNAIKENGFSSFYKINADYSSFYLFLLAIFTVLPSGELITLVNGVNVYTNWMFYIKFSNFICYLFISIAFYLIVKKITKDKIMAVTAFSLSFILPVQFFNTAIWGNSDAFYICYLIWALYFVISRKDFLSFMFLAFAFGNKLQAIFFFPLFFYLILRRRLKLYSVFGFVCGLFITFLPCYCAGGNFLSPFKYIDSQLNGYSNLNLGCANFYNFVGLYFGETFNNFFSILGILLILFFMGFIYFRNINLNDLSIIAIATFSSGITVFFLPHMHERYFFILDILIVLYCLLFKKKYHLIVLMQISSGIAYYHYLSGYYTFQILGENVVTIAALINIYVLSSIFFDILKLDHKIGFKEDLVNLEEKIKNELSSKDKTIR